MELLIDTASDLTCVGLSKEGALQAETTWLCRKRQSVELLPAIDALLRSQGVAPRDLRALVVAVGPGGFSSLRVGISTAKGLAVSLNIPLVGVSSFAIAALPFAGLGLPVRVLLEAGRGEVATTLFPIGEVGKGATPTFQVLLLDEVCRLTRERTLFCGEAVDRVADALRTRLGSLAVVPLAAALRSPAWPLAYVGWRRLQNGEGTDPAAVQPVYARQPSINVKRGP